MKNTLGDLNNHLFAQLERLTDESLSPEELATEIQRSKAVTGLASQIIQNGTLALNAANAVSDSLNQDRKLPKMLEG